MKDRQTERKKYRTERKEERILRQDIDKGGN